MALGAARRDGQPERLKGVLGIATGGSAAPAGGMQMCGNHCISREKYSTEGAMSFARFGSTLRAEAKYRQGKSDLDEEKSERAGKTNHGSHEQNGYGPRQVR